MTLCVGAICWDHPVPSRRDDKKEPRIIFCSDTRVGVPDYFSVDDAWGNKLHFSGSRMVMMFSGSVPHMRELCQVYDNHLESVTITRTNILNEIRVPPETQKRNLIDEHVKNVWGVSYEEYLGGKLQHLPSQELCKLAEDIAGINLNGELLIGTFVSGAPYLFTVTNSGRSSRADSFAVIGSGWHLAQAALYNRNYGPWMPIQASVYAVYEAKKLSEIDRNVGPDTTLVIMAPGKPTPVLTIINPQTMQELDREFAKHFSKKTMENIEVPDSAFKFPPGDVE